jgi:hypothetical protein
MATTVPAGMELEVNASVGEIPSLWEESLNGRLLGSSFGGRNPG